MEKNGFTWWEKHVEYKFIRDNKFIDIMPLDGNYEQAGDLIFSDKNFFSIIEFKIHNETEHIKQEVSKYPSLKTGKIECEYIKSNKGRYIKNEQGEYREIDKEVATESQKEKYIRKIIRCSDIDEFESGYFEKFNQQEFKCCHSIVYGDVSLEENKSSWDIYETQYLSFIFPEKKGLNTYLCLLKYSNFIKYLSFLISQKSGEEVSVTDCVGSFADVIVLVNNDKAILFSDVINHPKVQQDLKENGIEITNDYSDAHTPETQQFKAEKEARSLTLNN